MNKKAQAVHQHLRNLAQQSFALLNDLPARRELIKSYAAIDRSTQQYQATVQSVNFGSYSGEWIYSEGADFSKRILYVHGGSWVSGCAEMYRPLCAKLSELTGFVVFAVDYRLAPEHAFPAGLNDVCKSYLWLREHSPEGESTGEKIILAGDSAGGNLVLAALHKLQDEQQRFPDGVIALSPSTDFTGASPSMESRREADPILKPEALGLIEQIYLRGAVELTHPYASPLYGDFVGYPPILLQVGDAEVLRDDSVRLVEKARSQGCEAQLQCWAELPHVFQLFAPFLPEAGEAIAAMARFIRGLDPDQ